MKKIKKRLIEYVTKVLQVLQLQEMRVLPGNVAFFFVLALIPIITIVLTWFSDYSLSFIRLINEVVPSEASSVIMDAISDKSGGSGFTFSIIALFAASNGTYAIINAANTLYRVEKSDSIKNRIKSVILLVILLLLLVFLLVVPMFGGMILSLFKNRSFYDKIVCLYDLMKWPISFFLIYFNLKLIFTVAPSKTIKSKDTTYGALFTTVIWTVATAIFSYYLQNFANYSILYGNLSSIIILMMWIYLISYVLVLGMAINSVNQEE